MKRGISYQWVPVWVDKWLMGSTRFELEPGERSVFLDLIILAAKDDGFIRANDEMGYPHEYLSNMLNVSLELLENSIAKCIKVGKVEEKEKGIYYIKNWDEYSLSVSHKKRLVYADKSVNDTEVSHGETVSDSTSKYKYMSLSYIVFNKNLKEWEGITKDDVAGWKEAYPACDIDIELAKMREWILANPAKGKKSNYRRFISGWLNREQDRGGTRDGRGRGDGGTRPGDNVPPNDVFKANYEKHKAERIANGTDIESDDE